MDSSKAPGRLVHQSEPIRHTILASYWAVIILALPIWWHTTSIQRLSLPGQRILSQESNTLHFPIHISTQDPAFIAQIAQRAPSWDGLDVVVDSLPALDSSGQYTVVKQAGPPRVHGRQLFVPDTAQVDDLLSALLVPSTQYSRVMQYAPTYRLALTLLNEDAAAGTGALSWEIQQAISYHLAHTLNRVSTLHNFTIESQVQFHAPLAFSPGANGLTAKDLTVFVNSAEWALSSSVSNDPVIHLILFVPRSPLTVIDAPDTNAFLLPQWGGIVILNLPEGQHTHLTSSDLAKPFASFANQLTALLGVPSLPPSISSSNAAISHWQHDALIRRRAIENSQGSKETLRSIIKLVNKIENMPVGQDVKGDVLNALSALDNVYESTAAEKTLLHSAEALTLSSRAFFNPGMLALLYFPAEHKYAVYTPLFASAFLPLIGTTIREFVAWKKRRAAAKFKTA